MSAIFNKRPIINILKLSYALAGLILILCINLFSDNHIDRITYSIIGGILVGLGILLPFHNRGAYLQAGEQVVRGKYGFFSKINLPYSDIDFCYTDAGPLIILTKAGKRYQIGGILNAGVISLEILKHTALSDQGETDVKLLKKRRRVWTVVPFISFILLLIFLFLMILGTPEPPHGVYHMGDIVFLNICLAGMLGNAAAEFLSIFKIERLNLCIREAGIRERRNLFLHTPPAPGNFRRSFLNYNFTMRICVYSVPGGSDYYLTADRVTSENRMISSDPSEFLGGDTAETISDLEKYFLEITSFL